MYQLEEKIWFWTLIIIPIIVIVFLLVQLWKRKAQQKFADKTSLKRLSPNVSLFKSVLKILLLCLAFLCLTIALVNPKVGSKLETVKREGLDIVFAVDVSKSMLAEDIAPNRLDKSKQLVTQIIKNLASDRIGIIVYAAKAFPLLPITTDFGSAKMYLQSMSTDMMSSQGTAIGEAIKAAMNYFNDEDQANKVLIIISDGEDHGQQALDAAKIASEKGITILTIGVGDVKGGPIPIKQNGVVVSYKKDSNGETVITKLNEDTLSEIAKEANGAYINGSNTTKVVETIQNILNKMDKKEFETKQFADFKDQFQWFIGLAILFLVLDILVLDRKTEWLKKLNLFNENKNEK